jgi:hypothetical protein
LKEVEKTEQPKEGVDRVWDYLKNVEKKIDSPFYEEMAKRKG